MTKPTIDQVYNTFKEFISRLQTLEGHPPRAYLVTYAALYQNLYSKLTEYGLAEHIKWPNLSIKEVFEQQQQQDLKS